MNICKGNTWQQCSDNTNEFIVEIKGILKIYRL